MSKYGLQEQGSGLVRPPVRHGQRIQQQPDDIEEDESYYVTRPHTSARRYTNAPTRIRKGDTRYNVKYGAPPIPRRSSQPTTEDDDQDKPKKRRHVPWYVWVVVPLCIMILGWTAFNAVGSWWQGVLDNFNYGTPRTFQTDANVGHYGRVSHFIVINLNGEVEVIETQKGHPEASKIYTIVTMPEDQASIPATITFQEINKDGKIDALVHFGQTEIPMYNNGTGFQSQPAK